MKVRKKAIRLQPHEEALLRQLYRDHNTTIDAYDDRPDLLRAFVSQWNELSGRRDTSCEIQHFMRNRRKSPKLGGWERLEGRHERHESLGYDLTPEEMAIAERVYDEHFVANEIGSDQISHDTALADLLGAKFSLEAGRIVPGVILFAALMRKRKQSRLATIRATKRRDSGRGFDDLDQLAS
ncbi:MAG TPA: hypothetical protein VGN57_23530 [Pirellulaceae bacterium]|jgi:hypothetical protein|nr:hypothetical protein [Pirellulaceae bacterium]